MLVNVSRHAQRERRHDTGARNKVSARFIYLYVAGNPTIISRKVLLTFVACPLDGIVTPRARASA